MVVSAVTDSGLGQAELAGGIAVKPILLVEGVFSSAVLMGRVFRELDLLDQLAISMDCESALVRLRQSGSSKPRLILLDRQMSRMSAQSFLGIIKKDRELQVVPVVVLADSYDPDEVAEFYSLGAAGYMLKADDYSDLLEKMRALRAYWMLSRFPAVY